MKSRIMYIENKSQGLNGAARIGRVQFSNSGKSIRYDGKSFQSLNGSGFKANYFEEESGDQYWISGCRKDGRDRLYAGVVAIDADVRLEYWSEIRGRPECAQLESFQSHGKH